MENCIWRTIIQNGWFEEVRYLYGKDFPWEVRGTLSDWLSRDDSFMSFDPNEVNHHRFIFAFIDTLIHELSQRISNNSKEDDAYFFYKQRLLKLYKRIKSQDRMHLFQVIRDTLICEKQRVEELQCLAAGGGTTPTVDELEKSFAQKQEEIDNALTYVKEKCSSIEHSVSELINRSTTLRYSIYMLQQQQQNIRNENGYMNSENTQLRTMEDVQHETSSFNQNVQCVCNTVEEIIDCLSSVQSNVLKELEIWTDEQRLVALGKPSDKRLESIEKWFKIMAICLEILEIKLPQFRSLSENHSFQINFVDRIQGAIHKIGILRQNMINLSLLIIREPKQIVRTGPNVGPVHLLVLPFSTNMMISSVKAVFINCKTAVEYFSQQSGKTFEQLPTKSGDLKFGKGGLKVMNNKIEYQTMTVSKVSKSSKRGEQFVVEEKFLIYFRVTVNWQGRSAPVILHTTSLPISVTSHPVQEGKAWTHVLWYNAFPLKSRQQFEVPNDIPWNWLIEAINLSFIKLGKGLTEDQKKYLKDKLFNGREGAGFSASNSNSEMVSKKMFCFDTFATGKVDPETSEDGKSIKNYSFGEWLFCCLKILSWAPKNGKLAKYGLKHFWKDGKIVGFMSKEQLESSLYGTETGTFIIRFPENMPDTIGLYFYNRSATAPTDEKLLKQLLTIKDFNIKSLQDRILDSKAATFLFPNIEKEKAFTRMSKTDTSIVNGYFTVGIQEDLPSLFLQSISSNSAEQNLLSPSSSHSVYSNYSRYNAVSPAESTHSEYSSAKGSYSSYSPESSSNNTSVLEDFPLVSLDGIDVRILLDDNDMDI